MFEMIQRILNRGDKARSFVDNAAYDDAVAEVKAGYMDLIVNSKSEQTEIREMAYLAIRALADVDRQLRVYISDANYELAKNQPQNGVNA